MKKMKIKVKKKIEKKKNNRINKRINQNVKTVQNIYGPKNYGFKPSDH